MRDAFPRPTAPPTHLETRWLPLSGGNRAAPAGAPRAPRRVHAASRRTCRDGLRRSYIAETLWTRGCERWVVDIVEDGVGDKLRCQRAQQHAVAEVTRGVHQIGHRRRPANHRQCIWCTWTKA